MTYLNYRKSSVFCKTILPEESVSKQIGTVGSASHIQLFWRILRLLTGVPHEQKMSTSLPPIIGNSLIIMCIYFENLVVFHEVFLSVLK
jgi:hypothetical protein